MCHKAIELGGWHCHKRFCIPVDGGKIIFVYLIIELDIHTLGSYTKIIEFIWSIHMVDNDKIG